MAETWNKVLLDNVIKDEDDMVSDSASHISTQQSIKAYVDASASGSLTNLDGGYSNTNYGAVDGIDGGNST